MKICKSCKETKSLTMFSKNKNYKDGHNNYCKKCCQEMNKSYIERNKEKVSQKRKENYKNKREKILENKKNYYENNSCKILDYKREYYQKNKEILKEKRKKYVIENPLKIKLLNQKRRSLKMSSVGDFSEKDYENLLTIQNNSCFWCGELNDKLHIDHIVPLSKNGTNYLENICLSCKRCNSSKSSKNPIDFALQIFCGTYNFN